MGSYQSIPFYNFRLQGMRDVLGLRRFDLNLPGGILFQRWVGCRQGWFSVVHPPFG